MSSEKNKNKKKRLSFFARIAAFFGFRKKRKITVGAPEPRGDIPVTRNITREERESDPTNLRTQTLNVTGKSNSDPAPLAEAGKSEAAGRAAKPAPASSVQGMDPAVIAQLKSVLPKRAEAAHPPANPKTQTFEVPGESNTDPAAKHASIPDKTESAAASVRGMNPQLLAELKDVQSKSKTKTSEAPGESDTDLPASVPKNSQPQTKKVKPPVAPKPDLPQSFESAEQGISRVVTAHMQAKKDKVTLDEVKGYINNAQKEINDGFAKLRTSADPVRDLTHLLDTLDNITDLKVGIIRSTVPEKQGIKHIGSHERSRVVVRDARNQIELQAQSDKKTKIYDKKENVPESTVTIIAGQARGILKLIDLGTGISKDEKQEMRQKIFQVLEKSNKDIYNSSSITEHSKIVRGFSKEAAKILTGKDEAKKAERRNKAISDIANKKELSFNDQKLSELKPKDLAKVMLYARDFTNFESPDSPSIITVSNNIAKDSSNPLYAVSASVPLNPVSKEINRDHYGSKLQSEEWFKNLGKAEQGLVMMYEDKITSGRHIIPTQLRELAGIKNGYLEQTSVIDKAGAQKESGIMIRSATLAHNLGSGKDSVPITKQNMEHLQNLSGGRELVIDTLNHNLGAMLSAVSPDIRTERDIKRTMKMAASELKAQGAKIEFHNHGISLTLNKTKNMSEIGELYKKNNEAGTQKSKILCISCKSGKDRTGLAAFKGAMEWIEKKFGSDSQKNLLTEDASERITKAAHQEELASRNTRGIFGLKVKVILIGLRDRLYNSKINRLIDNKISDLNSVTLTLKDLISKPGRLYVTLSPHKNISKPGRSQVTPSHNRSINT